MTHDELERAIMSLDIAERAELAERIIQSLDDPSEREIERLWATEAQRRADEIERGAVTLRPAEDVLRNLRAELG